MFFNELATTLSLLIFTAPSKQANICGPYTYTAEFNSVFNVKLK
jgi:hypothetical protein